MTRQWHPYGAGSTRQLAGRCEATCPLVQRCSCPLDRSTGLYRVREPLSGAPCRAPAVAGKLRCSMHGGAAGSGAPKGNSNALKHGLYTTDAKEMRRHVRELSQKTKDIIDDI
ncbi:HGGxSTG domain-containing protein [Loktanella salsilacus]|uniref:HGGxSTG domain-containing protein n=1 Tax=Loktanella salsilacus TaxID=195913 RepID=UPI00373694CB